MITLTIGGILLAVAVPAFRSMTVNSRLTAQANELVSALNLARSEAIKRNASISFCRTDNPGDTACSTTTANWGSWIVATSGGTVIRNGTIPDYGSTIAVQSTLTSDTVTFSSDGLARTGGSLVTTSTLSVSTTGLSRDNSRCVTLGSGSRISTETRTGTCP